VTGNAGPGTGGIGVFDGQRWYNFNILTYGLGGDWPFPCDNADAICFRKSTGQVAFNPTNNGIREWNGSNFITLETGSVSDGLAEDSFGRLWTMGNYFSLRYHDSDGFVDVPIAGWGANVVPDPVRPGTVWGCANLEIVRTDGDYRYSRQTPDLPELQVTPLVVSPDGLVWFTNFNSNGIEASLVWFDGQEFGTITRAQGLPHAQIYDAEIRVVPDFYEIWLACASRGIAVLSVPFNQTTDVITENVPQPKSRLSAHPNPFNPQTIISYELPAPARVQLEIFDPRGHRVRSLVNEPRSAGQHTVVWDGRDDTGRGLSSGLYVARLRAGEVLQSTKLMLLK
jgi:hypothetical protein